MGDIEVLSFTADPPEVGPFQPTTLSWTVEVPTALTNITPVEIGTQGQWRDGTSGTATAKPVWTTEYSLTARTAIAVKTIPVISRGLEGAVTVTVDQSACVSGSILGAALTGNFRNQIAAIFQGASNITLGDYSVSINEADYAIDINVSLTIDVPDWFNANMTMSGSILIFMQGTPPQASALVQAQNVTADVSWSWYSNLLSAGGTAWAAAGMTQLAQVFLNEIVDQQVVVPLQQYVDQQIQDTITAAQQAHPGETFVLTSMAWDNSGDLVWTVCPL